MGMDPDRSLLELGEVRDALDALERPMVSGRASGGVVAGLPARADRRVPRGYILLERGGQVVGIVRAVEAPAS